MTTTMTPRGPQVRRNWLQPFSNLQDELGELTSRVFGDVGAWGARWLYRRST